MSSPDSLNNSRKSYFLTAPLATADHRAIACDHRRSPSTLPAESAPPSRAVPAERSTATWRSRSVSALRFRPNGRARSRPTVAAKVPKSGAKKWRSKTNGASFWGTGSRKKTKLMFSILSVRMRWYCSC